MWRMMGMERQEIAVPGSWANAKFIMIRAWLLVFYIRVGGGGGGGERCVDVVISKELHGCRIR